MTLSRSSSGITSPVKIVANIFISFIGAGLLGLPFAYKESGVMEGALIMALVGYLSVTAMLMLIDCKYAILTSGGRSGGRSITMATKTPLMAPDSSSDEDQDYDPQEKHQKMTFTDLTYGDVGLFALGPGGKKVVDVAIVISQIGFCCGYLIYITKNLSKYIPSLSQNQWLVFILPPLYLLTLVRHLNKLAVFSLFAQVSNVLALAVVFWFDFSHSAETPFTPKEFNLKGLPFFFAVSLYCYEGAGMILSLEESVHESLRQRFKSLFTCTMMFLTVLYISFGISGYLSFGPHTEDIITINLPHEDTLIDFAVMVKICLGVALFFTYPMMMFPVTHLLDKALGLQVNNHKGNLLRLFLVITTALVVIAVPNFSVLIGLIGATCCTLLAFILPALFHLNIFKQRMTSRQRYFDYLLIFLGIIGFVVGLWDTLSRIHHDPRVAVDEFSHNGTIHPIKSNVQISTSPPKSLDHITEKLDPHTVKLITKEGQPFHTNKIESSSEGSIVTKKKVPESAKLEPSYINPTVSNDKPQLNVSEPSFKSSSSVTNSILDEKKLTDIKSNSIVHKDVTNDPISEKGNR